MAGSGFYPSSNCGTLGLCQGDGFLQHTPIACLDTPCHCLQTRSRQPALASCSDQGTNPRSQAVPQVSASRTPQLPYADGRQAPSSEPTHGSLPARPFLWLGRLFPLQLTLKPLTNTAMGNVGKTSLLCPVGTLTLLLRRQTPDTLLAQRAKHASRGSPRRVYRWVHH